MAFLSKRATAIVQPKDTGAYLNPSRVPSGGSIRFHITSEEALDFFEVWGTNTEGKLKPFRFSEEPNEEDILAEMGNEFTRRENRDGTGFEAPKHAIAFQCWNYETNAINIAQFSQKSLIRELDKLTQIEEYADLSQWDFILGKEGSGLTTEYRITIVPMKKGSKDAIGKAIADADAKGFDINRLLTGENPFSS